MGEHDTRLADRVRLRGVLEPDEAARLLLPVADALADLHRSESVYAGLSPNAIGVDLDGRATLLPAVSVAPDAAFVSPTGASSTGDVWAFAAVLLQVMTAHAPGAYGRPLVVPRSTGWLAPIIELSLRDDPSQRPSMAEVAAYLRARVDPGPLLRRRRSRRAVVLVGTAVIVLLAVAGAALLFSGDKNSPGTEVPPASAESANSDDENDSAPAEPTTPLATPPATPTAAALKTFARDYVATASANPATGFTWLTPAYQQRSPRYSEVWSSIRKPRILSVKADVGAMSVSYTYRYRTSGGTKRTESVTLFLVQSAGRLLIANATAR